MYQYECDDCEDIEMIDELIPDGWMCECGGSMNRVKPDHFEEVEYIEKCRICYNRNNKDLCQDCRRH